MIARSKPTGPLGLNVQPEGIATARFGEQAEVVVGIGHTPPSTFGPRFVGDLETADGVNAAPMNRGGGFGFSGQFGLESDPPIPTRLAEQWIELQTNETRADEAARSIGTLVKKALLLSGPSRQCTVVIPDRLHERPQDYLLAALGPYKANVSLLWRPVAAALRWCDEWGAMWAHANREMGWRLLTLHLGLDEMEFALLEIVPSTHPSLPGCLPARSRPPNDIQPLIGWGWELLDALARASLPPGADVNELDRLKWCTPWIFALLQSLATTHAPLTSAERSVLSLCGVRLDWTEAARSEWKRWSLGVTPHTPLEQSPSSRGTSDHALSNFVERVCRALATRGYQIAGAVVTGPLAFLPAGSSTLGGVLLDRMGRSPAWKCTVESPHNSLLAEGALIHSLRIENDAPTYLDTLPRLEALVREGGEPKWLDLLRHTGDAHDDGVYVSAGRVWNRPQDLTGLRLAAGVAEPSFHLAMEGSSTVKQVAARLPRAPDKAASVRLRVSIQPARGSARVRILSDTESLRLPRSILLDWATMVDTGATAQQVLESQPLWFPPTTRRDSSLRMWDRSKPLVDSVLATASRSRPSSELLNLLKELRVLVRTRDVTCQTFATAVSSDGTVAEDEPRLHELVERCIGLLDTDGDVAENALAILGYTSANDPTLAQYVADLLTSTSTSTKALWIAAGNCLRTPDHLAMLLSRVATDLHQDVAVDDRLMALERALSFRHDATARSSSEACRRLERALEGIIHERTEVVLQGRGGWGRILPRAFRAIAMLLRRRRYESEFMSIESDAVGDLRRLCIRVENAVKRGRVPLLPGVGTQATMASAFRQIVAYLEGSGSGGLILPQEDEPGTD